MNYRNPELLELARGKPCMMRLQRVCNGNPETVVWAHLNSLDSGKGTGIKGHDSEGGFACSACHDALDGRTRVHYSRNELREAGLHMMRRTMTFLLAEGLIAVVKPKK
ncbi:MAG: DUF1364 family protein [Gammaproteobacteria bacterium]|nr:DUF1364 family protein [Gammaproteobacteria bacterium]